MHSTVKLGITIDIISSFSILLPTLVGIFLFNRIQGPLRLVIYYVLITFVLEVFVYYLTEIQSNNMFLFHIHTYVEFILLALFYRSLFRTIQEKRSIDFLIFGFLVFSAVNMISYESILEFNALQRHVECVLVTLIAGYYLFGVYQRKKRIGTHIFLTWSLLLYFNGILFLFIGKQVLSTESGVLWIWHGVLNIILNFSFVISLFKSGRRY